MKSFSQFLLEMSFEAKVIISHIRGVANPIINHLIKCYMMPNSFHKDHWIQELDTWFIDIALMTVKPKNKKLSRSTYFKILFDEYLEGIDDYTKKIRVNSLMKKYPDEMLTFNVKEFNEMRNALKEFFLDISEKIAENKFDGDTKILIEKHLKR